MFYGMLLAVLHLSELYSLAYIDRAKYTLTSTCSIPKSISDMIMDYIEEKKTRD